MRHAAAALVAALALTGCAGVQATGGGRGETTRRIIQTEQAPAAIGPYSQAIVVGDTIYCSGQIPIDPATGELNRGSIEEQTHLALRNLGAVLKAAGYDYADAVKVTVFLRDLDDYAAVNRVYEEYFRTAKPARAAVQVARLPKDVGIEIDCIAVKAAGR